ncbi:MAG: prepilin-type N-terminal cleavage/methylation domain-containing protein [Opitutus sp.]|nr:prepilin-type N-terminal cleavage/methylation domain-containing protein [Opitutus sp.]
MIFYTFIHRRALLCENLWRVLRGFTLLELVLALFILGVLAATLAPSMTEIVNRNRIDAEKRTLGDLADTTTASFENTDLTNLNLAALAGTIGPGDTPTEFSASSTAAYATTNNNSWFAKIARLRGLAPVVGTPPTTAAQPALAQIAFNLFGNPRLLFAGPNQSGQQRFLLLSFMARSDQLTLPAYDGSAAWFNAIWNADWESRTAAPPAYWSGILTPAQLAAWNQGSGGLTQSWRLCVRRIVLQKFTVTVNDNHATNAAFVSFNNAANAFTAAANSGVNTTPEILGGRLVTVNQGTAWPGVQALQFRLHENATVTVQ